MDWNTNQVHHNQSSLDLDYENRSLMERHQLQKSTSALEANQTHVTVHLQESSSAAKRHLSESGDLLIVVNGRALTWPSEKTIGEVLRFHFPNYHTSWKLSFVAISTGLTYD